jgi:hypothetical protein
MVHATSASPVKNVEPGGNTRMRILYEHPFEVEPTASSTPSRRLEKLITVDDRSSSISGRR